MKYLRIPCLVGRKEKATLKERVWKCIGWHGKSISNLDACSDIHGGC